MIFISELNLELIIDVKWARLPGYSLDLHKMRRTLAHLPHLSRPLMSWLLILILVCHSSHILQPRAWYIFHFDERTTDELDV